MCAATSVDRCVCRGCPALRRRRESGPTAGTSRQAQCHRTRPPRLLTCPLQPQLGRLLAGVADLHTKTATCREPQSSLGNACERRWRRVLLRRYARATQWPWTCRTRLPMHRLSCIATSLFCRNVSISISRVDAVGQESFRVVQHSLMCCRRTRHVPGKTHPDMQARSARRAD